MINEDNGQGKNYLKWFSLITLVVQNAVYSISMRYARTRPGDLFTTSTAVVMSEVLKLGTCLVIVSVEDKNVTGFIKIIYQTIILQPFDTLKVSVISLIYLLQNNLNYVAVSHLDVGTFQVASQLKLLTTAVFAVIILKKRLYLFQWISLLLLVVGVCLTQVNLDSKNVGKTGGHPQNKLIGLAAVSAASVMSGFAGVYFEKILKSTNSVSIWVRNIQLSVLGIPLSLIASYAYDGRTIQEKGFFFAYDEVVWFVIANFALGGLVIAAVIKYADNILKGFATSLAIIIGCLASVFILDFKITLEFVIGVAVVISSVILYEYPMPPAFAAWLPCGQSLPKQQQENEKQSEEAVELLKSVDNEEVEQTDLEVVVKT